MEKILEINLSTVAMCNADCVFCPRSDHKKQDVFMPVGMVEKIVDEVMSPEFKAKHDFKSFVVGENGEPTLHPQFLEIMRVIRKSPSVNVLFSNFSMMTPNLVDAIFKEGLADVVHMNIDGITAKTYNAVKRLSYDRVERNLIHFLEARKLYGNTPPLIIHVVTASNYVKAVEKAFGAWPHKMPMDIQLIPNEHEQIIAKWKPLLREGDHICADDCLLWAERYHLPRRQGDFSCLLIERIKRSVFFAPNGDAYCCCFDVGNEIVVGNINRESIDAIHSGEKKAYVLKVVSNREFPEAWPCDRVDCCQVQPFV